MRSVESANSHPDRPDAAPVALLVLVVMDGVGIGRGDEFDAVATARTPHLDRLQEEALSRSIFAHGPYVGLSSKKDQGNSEVGHNTMGAGRVIDQGAKRIDNAIASGAIWGSTWRRAVEAAFRPEATLHLIGLLSDGGVHSSTSHLRELLYRACADGVQRVRVHVLFDGRDVPDRTADSYLEALEEQLSKLHEEHGVDYRVSSGGGRMTTTMDRCRAPPSRSRRRWTPSRRPGPTPPT
jgi:2,3-bisphosphoglycerate-independent phosphoglycerate mutase